MARRPSGREEMIAANRARARARGNQNRVSPSKVQNKTAEQASDAQNTSTNTNDGPTVFRYPVRALDENTDMLLIRIFSYKGDPSDAFGIEDFLKGGKIKHIGNLNYLNILLFTTMSKAVARMFSSSSCISLTTMSQHCNKKQGG